jgi:hypothetical protein
MKFFLIIIATGILFSSCLKQSIPDAMLNSQNGGNVTATISYKVNGNPVSLTVADANSQDSLYYTLGCIKQPGGSYLLDALTNTGEFTFYFLTDTLKPGNYYINGHLDLFIMEYNGTNGYLYAATDSIGFTITSNNKGHINGTFSGRLSPLLDANNNTYGTPGSVVITDGSFQNIPVLY